MNASPSPSAANAPPPAGWRRWLVLLVIAGLVAFAFQGSRGLQDSTEGRYAECARQMLATGNLLFPVLYNAPHWTKPPPTYWAVAAGLRLCGENAWGARLFNAVALVACVLLVAGLGRAMWGPREGLLAGLIFATSFTPVAAAFIVSTDLLLTCWLLLGLWAYWRARRAASAARRAAWVTLVWLAFGLAFFTKGPPALLVVVALVVYHLAARAPCRLGWPPAVALGAAVGLYWYLLMVLTVPGLLGYFLGKEVVARVASADFERNPEWWAAFTVYGPVLTAGAGVWLWPAVVQAWRRYAVHRAAVWRALWRQRGPGLFLVLWVAVPLPIFMLSGSRLHLYVLPLFAALPLALARALVTAADATPGAAPWVAWRRWVPWGLAMAALLVAVKGLSTRQVLNRTHLPIYEMVQEVRAGGDAGGPIHVLSMPQMYALSFYNREHIVPVCTEATRREGYTLTLDRALAWAARRSPAAPPTVFATRHKHRDDLIARAAAAGLRPVHDARNRYWYVVAYAPPPPPE